MNSLKKLNEKLSYNKMSQMTGLSSQFLQYTANLSDEKIVKCKLQTFITLKEKLNIDLADCIKNYHIIIEKICKSF